MKRKVTAVLVALAIYICLHPFYSPSQTTINGARLAVGILDGLAPVTLTTACGTAAHCALGGTYKSGYTFNEQSTAGTAVFYDLPVAIAGMQYCVKNDIVGGTGAATTGIITVTPQSGSYITQYGTLFTVSHGIASGGAAGDAACFVAKDATHWDAVVAHGTWATN